MGTYYTQHKPLSFEENQIRGLEHAKTYGEFQPFKDTWDGLSDESGWIMGGKRLFDEIMGNRAWPIDENYNYKADPQLQGYDAVIEQFAFSKSAEETAWMLDQKRQDALVQKESPFYFLGRIVGAVTDPTTYLAWKVKAARSALAFGSALTTEEIIKQNIDPFRQDDIVPWVATGGYVIPAVLNKFTANIPAKVADDAVALDAQWNKDLATTTTLYRGTGGGSQVNIPSGSIFDDATYFTPSKNIAQMYGTKIETTQQTLSNPFIIKSDTDFIKFFESTGKKWENYDINKINEFISKRYLELRKTISDPEKIFPILNKEATEKFGYTFKGIGDPKIKWDGWSLFYPNRAWVQPQAVDEFNKQIIIPILNQAKKQIMAKGHDGIDVQIGIRTGGKEIFDPANLKNISKDKSIVTQKFGHDQTIFFRDPKDAGIKIYEDGIAVDANKLDSPPSSVGSAGIKSNVTSSPAKRMEGEAFIKTRLKWFGEDGPWTPVFRVVKSSSLTGKKMMESLLDTPLLKIKNTPAHKFTATEGSIETKMKVMKVDELEAHMAVRNLYLDYIGRLQGENAKPKTNIGLYLHNRLTPNRLTLNEFSKEVAKARIMKSHPIKEVDEAARIYGEKVYDKLWKEIDELGIREMPIKKEMNLWEGVLTKMKKDKTGVVSFYEPSTKTTVKYSKTEVENLLKDLKELMARVKSGSKVDNYINRIYLKDAIKAKPEVFRRIIIENNKRQGITMNKKALDDLIEDLSNYFPFQRFEKTPWKKWLEEWDAYGKGGVKGLDEFLAHKRFIFNKDRYARSLRARTLNLDAKAQLELIDEGLIMSDIFGLGKAYSRQMIPDILLTRKFGDPNGKGYSYISEAESMTSPGLLTVANEYSMKLIGKKGKTRIALIKERDQVLADLEAAIELLRGTFGLPGDPHAWYSIAMRTMKHYNTLTMLTGFMAAVPDAARIVMTSGIKRGFRTQFDLFGNFLADGKLFKLSKAEARSAGEAWDLITGQRAALMGDVGDMFGVANQIERGMGKLAHFNFMYINMMSRWTEFAKSLASVTIGSRIIEDSIKWAKGADLADKWKTALASSGIDEQMAKRIAAQFEEHGKKTQYNFMANTAAWTDDVARNAFRNALNKDINITIVTPGLGDTPKWMSYELGSVFSQFKKFAMGAQQRMLMRGMQEQDADFMFGALLLVGSGMFIDAVYHKTRFNRDYSKLSLTQKLLNAFDRSGLAGIYTDINKALETLSDNRIGIAPLLGESKPYGSSMRWKMGTVGGPTGGQLYNIADILFDIGGKKYNHHTAKNVRRLIPFQNVWYLDWLFDDLQKGLRFK